MARAKVFVSYSHKDAEGLEQLQAFLRPLERDGVIDPWVDTRLAGGDYWEEEIERALDAASAALLLISQNFLASDFIVEKELPRILAREAAGALKVLPIFLGHSSVEDHDLSWTDPRTGRQGKTNLTRFQGYGSPQKPLSELNWSDRNREYTQIARRLRDLARVAPAPSKARIAPVRPLAAIDLPTVPSRSYELTVVLERREDMLDFRYHLPGVEPIGSASHLWAELLAAAEPLAKNLDRPGGLAFDPAWGTALALMLFGPDSQWRPVLSALFSETALQPTPIWKPVRLRIVTEDPFLAGLPWRFTSWKGRPLAEVGWTFEVSHFVDPAENVTTTAPANVLVVAPRTGGAEEPPDPAHPEAVLEVLRQVWPTGRDNGFARVVRTRRELENALLGMRPHLVYVHARGDLATGRLSLLLDGAEPGTVERVALATLFKEHCPAALYLNVAGLVQPGGLSPTQVLGGQVPLLLWRRSPEWVADSATVALTWLRHWLGKGEDPVAALHQVTRDEVASGGDAATLAVHSGYRTWRTAVLRGTGPLDREKYVRLLLDRSVHKASIGRDLRELTRSDGFRVMALVVYAEPGNAVDSFADQLKHDLELEGDHFAEINWLRLEFPVSRESLRTHLEEELKLQLGADPQEHVPHLLRRHAPRIVGASKRAVLWLNWGSFGEGRGRALQAPLSPRQLAEWVRFSSEFLVAHCPADLRIVSSLAIESRAESHRGIRETLKKQEQEPWSQVPGFWLNGDHVLGRVPEGELRRFLRDPNKSSCPPAIHIQLAERIIERSKGDFEQTVAILEEGERGSWYDLLKKLQREQGVAAVDDDEPF